MKTTKTILMSAIFLLSITLNAQLWQPTTASKTATKEKEFRKTIPSKYQLFTLDTDQLKSILRNTPSRFSQRRSQTVIELPAENGVLQKFNVYEASVLSEKLSSRFPDIKSFVAKGIDDPTAIARFSLSKVGLHVMISSGKHSTVYVDPYTKDHESYISYSRADLPADPNGFECLVEDSFIGISNKTSSAPRNADDGKLRTFRLALACTGEYSDFHLNNQGISDFESDEVKKGAVLAAMNTSMTRVNGVFERDLSLTMVIVDNNTDLIFLDANTDNLSNNSAGALINQSQTVCDNIIGSANYDIGHTFSTGGGGLAQLRSPCTGSKARGITGLGNPINDPYDIDYVAHEMGHQYGGNHTQNNSCQRSNASVEPGSASTIMGYAGICAPNVQNNSDDYFHAISIEEMWNNISTGSGSCASQSDTNNAAPTADAGSNLTIPASTPFVLRGNGTDSDSGNSLTYCWEQMDSQPATMPPSPTSTNGPVFRSLDPSDSPDRYMPALPTVLNGQTASTWEVVPSVSRDMNFRLTVRDNAVGGSGSASDNTIISVDGNSGPFLVTSQNSSVTWDGGTTQTITWDVASTNVAPVNSPNVNIMLSIDGGTTFTTLLAASTPNDGSHDITVPDVGNTTEARIMVAGTDHLFYNVNTTNFEINSTLGVEEFALKNFKAWPNPSTGIFNIAFTPNSSTEIDVTLYDITGKLVDQKTFDNNTTSDFSETFDYSNLNTGMYFVSIKNGNKTATARIVKK